jgi:hypothetical protein
MEHSGQLHGPTGQGYLTLHEPVGRYLFDGIRRFIDMSETIDMFDVGRRWASPETQGEAAKDLRRFQTYQVALATLCGGILQMADIGLYLCSKNEEVPVSCRGFTSRETAKYCVGPVVHGLPMGVYVHAGRNQFAHWGDERKLDASESWPAGSIDSLRMSSTDCWMFTIPIRSWTLCTTLGTTSTGGHRTEQPTSYSRS